MHPRAPVWQVLLYLYCIAGWAQASDGTCAAGTKRLAEKEPCIPTPLFNYLYCLSKSGDGKISVVKKASTANTASNNTTVAASGSGVVISIGGSIDLKRDEVKKAISEIEQKIDPSLASKCESFARSSDATQVAQSWPRTDGAYLAPGVDSKSWELIRFADRNTAGYAFCKDSPVECAKRSRDGSKLQRLGYSRSGGLIFLNYPLDSGYVMEYRLSDKDGRLDGHMFYREKPEEQYFPMFPRSFYFIPAE